jgi:hypothetical protein
MWSRQQIKREAAKVKADEARTEAENANKRLLIAKESLREKQQRIKRPPLNASLLRLGVKMRSQSRLTQARTAIRMVQEWERTVEEEYRPVERDKLQEEIQLFLSSLTKRY